MSTLAKALSFASIGWRVFPCGLNKKPLTKHGYQDASGDPETIRFWFADQNPRLIGIACAPSGFFAVDIDNRESWKEFLAGRPCMVGPVQRTPRGGTHLLYKLPGGAEIPNSAGWLAPGVDLRSNGYICTGPSYSWLAGHGPEIELPEPPAWLIEEIHKRKTPPPAQPDANRNGQHTPAGVDYLYHKYLGFATPGNRNDACYRLGLQLHYADVSQVQALDIARRFARECPQPPGAPFTEREAEYAMRSAYNAAKRPAWVLRSA